MTRMNDNIAKIHPQNPIGVRSKQVKEIEKLLAHKQKNSLV